MLYVYNILILNIIKKRGENYGKGKNERKKEF